ncbi:MAG: hypothetical protein OXG80_07360 [Chloroflexi bacterium]|nr:hypothetical protein [Chloroflexota bacterium]
MTLPEQPIESHDIHSRRLIRHAEVMLEVGDRLQASEKAWGAVAHRLKVVADNRGWKYETHTDAARVVNSLAMEQGNPRIRTLFDVAELMHINYYKDTRPIEYIRQQTADVKELLSILERIE